MPKSIISFKDTSYKPIEVEKGHKLSDHLNANNSPVLFGCRTGLCGTCIKKVELLDGSIEKPNDDESEALEIYGTSPSERLICQVNFCGHLLIE